MTPGKLLARVARSSPRFPAVWGKSRKDLPGSMSSISGSAQLFYAANREVIASPGRAGGAPFQEAFLKPGRIPGEPVRRQNIRAACVGVELAQSASESALVETWPTQEKVPGC